MFTYFYGPALETELAYRRAALRREAADHRLARLARCASRVRHPGKH